VDRITIITSRPEYALAVNTGVTLSAIIPAIAITLGAFLVTETIVPFIVATAISPRVRF
jgi:hypothetical protein